MTPRQTELEDKLRGLKTHIGRLRDERDELQDRINATAEDITATTQEYNDELERIIEKG